MAGNRDYDTTYDPASVGYRRPDWCKEPLGKGGNSVQRLAAFICTRTAPGAFKDSRELYWNILEQNAAVCDNWDKAHQLIFMAVLTKLHIRDGYRLQRPTEYLDAEEALGRKHNRGLKGLVRNVG